MKTKILVTIILFIVISNRVKAFDYFIDGLYYNIIDTENNFAEVTFGPDTLNSYSFNEITISDKVTIKGEPYCVKRIGDKAFMNCNSISSIELLSGITSIGNSSFAGCSNMTSIFLSETINNIDIFAFAACEKLETINLPNELTRISDAIFAGCTGLKKIIIPDGVNYIGQKAFFLCSSLENISIPKTVPDLKGCAIFLGCRDLKEMVVNWEKPIKMHPALLGDVNVKTCILIVPNGSISAYKKSKGWKEFNNIKEAL